MNMATFLQLGQWLNFIALHLIEKALITVSVISFKNCHRNSLFCQWFSISHENHLLILEYTSKYTVRWLGC